MAHMVADMLVGVLGQIAPPVRSRHRHGDLECILAGVFLEAPDGVQPLAQRDFDDAVGLYHRGHVQDRQPHDRRRHHDGRRFVLDRRRIFSGSISG